MIINYTGIYYKKVLDYRQELKAIWNEYESKMQNLEPYKGSTGYTEEARKAEHDRDAAIKAAQEEASRYFGEVIEGMRQTATNRPIAAPTAEQLNILSVLKMRDSVRKDELRQAYETLKENPLCLSVLDEIARKNEFHGMAASRESSADMMAHIDTLEDAAKRLCKLDKPDSRREQIGRASPYSPDYTPGATYSLMVDRDFESEADCMAYMGNVRDLSAFQNVVCK